MMKIHINTIAEDGQQFVFEERAAAFAALKDLEKARTCLFKTPVKTRLEAIPHQDVIRITGTVHTTATLDCSRCLCQFDMDIETDFSVTYERKPAPDPEDDAGETELDRDQMSTIAFSGDTLDLRDEIAQQVVMSLPFQPLCNTACKGLCKNCGTDLNKGPCQCDPTQKDGPFSVLKNLKIDG